MGRNKNSKGAVVENYKGYNIRMMMRIKSQEGQKGVSKQHTGKYGIYAGKKFLKEIDQAIDGRKIVDALIVENQKQRKLNS